MREFRDGQHRLPINRPESALQSAHRRDGLPGLTVSGAVATCLGKLRVITFRPAAVHKVLLAVVLLFTVRATLAEQNNQTAKSAVHDTADFEWVSIEEPAGRFLLPVDWHLSISKGKLLGSFVVRQTTDGDNRDRRIPQLTVNPISMVRMHHGLLSEKISTYVAAIRADTRKKTELVEPVSFRHFEGTAVRFQATVDGETQRFHRYYIADDSTNMLLVMTFRASVQDWDMVWKTGHIMMNNFHLDTDIRAHR